MAADLQRDLQVKTLENRKAREKIKELQDDLRQITSIQADELSLLAEENKRCKEIVKNAENQNRALQDAIENTEQLLSDALGENQENVLKLQRALSEKAELESKFNRLQEINKELTENLTAGKHSQVCAEKEVDHLREENSRLTYDLNNLRHDDDKLKREFKAVSVEVIEKEEKLQQTCTNFNKAQQQNALLQKDIEKLNRYINQVKLKTENKDSEIDELTCDLEESFKGHKKEVKMLKKEISELQAEVKNSDENRQKLTETLVKNKSLFAENKKLATANRELLARNGVKDQNEDYINRLKRELEVKTSEASELKRKCQEKTKALEENNAYLKLQSGLEEESELLKKSLRDHVEEIAKLKTQIEDLVASNVHKLHIIVKLSQKIKAVV